MHILILYQVIWYVLLKIINNKMNTFGIYHKDSLTEVTNFLVDMFISVLIVF